MRLEVPQGEYRIGSYLAQVFQPGSVGRRDLGISFISLSNAWFNPRLSLDFVASSLSWCETGARTGFRRGGIVSL